MSRCRTIILAFLGCLLVSSAHAQSRVAVRPFFGPHSAEVRKTVISVLSRKGNIKLVPSANVERHAKRLKVDPDSRQGRLALAAALHVAAWVEAIIQRHGKDLRATLVAYDGRTHRRIARSVTTRRSGRALAAAIGASFWRENGVVIQAADAPRAPVRKPKHENTTDVEEEDASDVEEEDAPAVEEEDAPAAESSASPLAAKAARTKAAPTPAEATAQAETPAAPETAPSGVQTILAEGFLVSPSGASNPTSELPDAPTVELPDALTANLTIGTLSRFLSYEDAVTQNLGDHALSVAPQASLDLRYFPAAHFTSRWPSNIGVDLQAQFALPGDSRTKAGDRYATSADAYGVGARVRLPSDMHEVSFVLGYAIRQLQLADSKGKPAPAPDVEYRSLRAGGEGDFPLGPKFRLGASAAWLFLLGVGELGSSAWFPRATGSGIEGAVFASYGLTAHLDLTLAVGLAHYFFSFQPQPGDKKVAGGATDDFVTSGLGLRLRL